MVEDVTVQHVEAFAAARVNVVPLDGDVGEPERQDGGQEIVVVAAQIDDAGVVLDLQQAADEVRVTAFLLFAASADEFPSVDDVAAENQGVAGVVFQEAVGLLCFRPD